MHREILWVYILHGKAVTKKIYSGKSWSGLNILPEKRSCTAVNIIFGLLYRKPTGGSWTWVFKRIFRWDMEALTASGPPWPQLFTGTIWKEKNKQVFSYIHFVLWMP